MSSIRKLVVTCHADDEALWCGGWLAAHPGTHVACASVDTRPGSGERVVRFFRSCEVLGSVGHIIAGTASRDSLDVGPISLFASQYDIIITHNPIGEYGHPAHIELHNAMKLLKKTLWVFNYGICDGDPIDFDTKRKAIECYENPKILERRGKQFDLSRETLLSC